MNTVGININSNPSISEYVWAHDEISLPLTSFEELEHMEEMLGDDAFKKKLVRLLF